MNTQPSSTLGRRALSDQVAVDFRTEVAKQLEQGQRALAQSDTAGPRHLAAVSTFLDSLGDFGPPATDSRTYALFLQASQAGTEGLTLSPSQSELLHRLGTVPGSPPSPDDTFTELVIVGLEDALADAQAKIAAATTERDKAVEEAARSAAKAEEAQQLETELAESREEIVGLGGELQELRGNLNYLRGMGIEDAPPEVAPVEEAPPSKTDKRDRIHVKGEENVYYRERQDGTKRYEVRHTTDGKREWIPVGPDIKEAIALRDELAGEAAMEAIAA